MNSITANVDDFNNYYKQVLSDVIAKDPNASLPTYTQECMLKEAFSFLIDPNNSFNKIHGISKPLMFFVNGGSGTGKTTMIGYALAAAQKYAEVKNKAKVRYGKQLGMKSFTKDIAEVVIEMFGDVYPELSKNKNFVFDNLSQEEEKFEKTLENGLKEFEKGTSPFVLFTTYGFPLEMTKELAKEKGVEIDEKKFFEDMEKHQELSRTSSAGMFKGGLSDAGEENKKLHTATHLLRRALEEILQTEITQKGSNITAERLRFDFNFGRKMTDEEKKKVEDLVNEKISLKLPVHKIIMNKEEAEKTGAAHIFGDKYGDEVSIYYIGDSLETAHSKEFCGGPHVDNIGTLGHFRITKEEAVSAGVRRIKAVLE